MDDKNKNIMPDWSVDTETVFARYETSKRGLTGAQAASLLLSEGKNELSGKKKKSFFMRLMSQLKDKMIIVLFLAAAASFAASYFSGKKDADFLIIIAIVVINAFMGAFQESKAEKAIDALKKLTSPETEVIRDGAITRIKSADVVPGDIILLSKGSFVPADCRIFESESLSADESPLTGESMPCEKDGSKTYGIEENISDIHNMAWGGTAIVSGHGKAIVTATGMKSRMGAIASMLGSSEKEETPLQKRLSGISSLLGNGALMICGIMFLISVLKGLPADEMFLTSVGLAVAAIPEGLPAIVTIVLSIGVKEMAKRKAVVKKLPAVETLGCTGVICSDKTGTLTQNKMTVTETYGDEKILTKLFVLCNNDASPTESALIEKALESGANVPLLKKEYTRVKEIPFDSSVKRMITVHRYKNGYLSVLNGAPDVIAPMCSNGDYISSQTRKMAEKALRVIGFAVCETESLPSDPEKLKYHFAGLAGMIDPPREEVCDAVKRCKEAGIKPVMITGDHKDTAVAIATELGIMEKGGTAYTESELKQYAGKELEEKIAACSVFARTTPEFKVKIVEAY
ncbi:MAG: HAD-IC family P-type ATPase, partial [Clostridia bacterium]|nr:HAD-IC family P-type ATPase [Clostridia bacterium]